MKLSSRKLALFPAVAVPPVALALDGRLPDPLAGLAIGALIGLSILALIRSRSCPG